MSRRPLVYVDCDVPEGMTIEDYRRGRQRPRKSGWRERLRRRRRRDPRRPATR